MEYLMMGLFLLTGLLVGYGIGFAAGEEKVEKRADREEDYHRKKVDSLMQTIIDMKQVGYQPAPQNDSNGESYLIDREYELEAARRRKESTRSINFDDDPYGITSPLPMTDG